MKELENSPVIGISQEENLMCNLKSLNRISAEDFRTNIVTDLGFVIFPIL